MASMLGAALILLSACASTTPDHAPDNIPVLREFSGKDAHGFSSVTFRLSSRGRDVSVLADGTLGLGSSEKRRLMLSREAQILVVPHVIACEIDAILDYASGSYCVVAYDEVGMEVASSHAMGGSLVRSGILNPRRPDSTPRGEGYPLHTEVLLLSDREVSQTIATVAIKRIEIIADFLGRPEYLRCW